MSQAHPAQQQIEETMRRNQEAVTQAQVARERMQAKLAELNLDPVDVERFLEGSELPSEVQAQIREEQQAQMADLEQRKQAARAQLHADAGEPAPAPRSWRARRRV